MLVKTVVKRDSETWTWGKKIRIQVAEMRTSRS